MKLAPHHPSLPHAKVEITDGRARLYGLDADELAQLREVDGVEIDAASGTAALPLGDRDPFELITDLGLARRPELAGWTEDGVARSDGPERTALRALFVHKQVDGRAGDFAATEDGAPSAVDFAQIFAAGDPMEAAKQIAYRPTSAREDAPITLFCCGANQGWAIAHVRAKRLADEQGLRLLTCYNATLINDDAVLPKTARLAESIVSTLNRFDIGDSPAIANGTKMVLEALHRGHDIVVAGESDGSGHARRIVRDARRAFVEKAQQAYLAEHGHEVGAGGRAKRLAVRAWNDAAGRHLSVVTFGNASAPYPYGPNYLHVSMEGDPLPDQKLPLPDTTRLLRDGELRFMQLGTTPDSRPNDRAAFLRFERMFPKSVVFENHNIRFLSLLLGATAEKNGLPANDITSLVQRVRERADAVELARPWEVDWPADIDEQLWNATFEDDEGVDRPLHVAEMVEQVRRRGDPPRFAELTS